MKYLSYYIILLVVILVSLYFYNYYDNDNDNYTSSEGFTTQFRQMYRPHARNIRIFSEGFYNNHKNNLDSVLRRFGIV